MRPKNQLWLAPCYRNNCSCQDIKGPSPQQHSRLVRLANPWCRKRPCCSRTYRCWSRRSRCCWPSGCRSCHLLRRYLLLSSRLLGCSLFRCWLLRRYLLLSSRLLGCSLFRCWLLRRYLLLSSRLLGCSLFRCWLLRRYLLLSSRLLGCSLFRCWLLRRYLLLSSRLLGCSLLRCWFSFLLCCHFVSPYINES